MLIDILKYHHPNYDIIVRTDNIASAWERFRGRIGYRNSLVEDTQRSNICEYCNYFCDDDCSMEILSPMDGYWYACNSNQRYWPVVYETNRYQIYIQLNDVDHDQTPRLFHIRKDVENFFSFDWDGCTGDERDSSRYGHFVGIIDFLNEPGLFRLSFEYYCYGQPRRANIGFDVVSPKLDIKNDYINILREVNEEFEGYLFRYLSLTMQTLGSGRQQNLVVWMQVFQDIVKNYLKNIERIIRNPHSKVRTKQLHAHADRIKRWTSTMEEQYIEKEAAGKIETHYFGYEIYENTVNSMENRFVKYTLLTIGKKLDVIFEKVLERNNTDVSDSYREDWIGYQQKIQHLLKNPFFQSVGRFEGMQHESLVLQSRMGYQQIYKDWLKLRRGIDFYSGAMNIGTLQIWEIYELWCFIKVKRMILKILGLDPKSPLISEPNGSLITYNKNNKENQADYRICIEYPKAKEDLIPECQEDEQFIEHLRFHEGCKLSLHYQHTFSRKSEDDQHIHTFTTEQRPDIILNIYHKDITLTYLYDAKYRVWSDTKLDREMDNVLLMDDNDFSLFTQYNGADAPPADAINQMHRYRDAIYYGMADDVRPHSKEVIGGYILFPGRGTDESIRNKFYSKSIDSINIGAFPLLPCGGSIDENGRDTDGPQLYDHLKKIVLDYQSSLSHVEESIPQRGLFYSSTSPAEEIYMILTIDKDVNPNYEGVLTGDADTIVMGKKGLDEKMDVQSIRYIAPIKPGGHIIGYYRVIAAHVKQFDNTEYPVRVVFIVDNWTMLPHAAKFGMARAAYRGFYKTANEFFSFIKDHPI